MRLQDILTEKGIMDTVGRKLKVKTTKGKPSLKDAPKWAKFIGKTPEGAYHWLEKNSPVQNEKSDKYFPKAGRTEFSGFEDMPDKGLGFVKPITELEK